MNSQAIYQEDRKIKCFTFLSNFVVKPAILHVWIYVESVGIEQKNVLIMEWENL